MQTQVQAHACMNTHGMSTGPRNKPHTLSPPAGHLLQPDPPAPSSLCNLLHPHLLQEAFASHTGPHAAALKSQGEEGSSSLPPASS